MKKLNLNLAIAKTFCCDHNALYLLSVLVRRKEQTRLKITFGTGGESTADFPACRQARTRNSSSVEYFLGQPDNYRDGRLGNELHRTLCVE